MRKTVHGDHRLPAEPASALNRPALWAIVLLVLSALFALTAIGLVFFLPT